MPFLWRYRYHEVSDNLNGTWKRLNKCLNKVAKLKNLSLIYRRWSCTEWGTLFVKYVQVSIIHTTSYNILVNGTTWTIYMKLPNCRSNCKIFCRFLSKTEIVVFTNQYLFWNRAKKLWCPTGFIYLICIPAFPFLGGVLVVFLSEINEINNWFKILWRQDRFQAVSSQICASWSKLSQGAIEF